MLQRAFELPATKNNNELYLFDTDLDRMWDFLRPIVR